MSVHSGFDLFQLQESRGFRRKIKRLEELNKKLALELEHERGKLTGLGQSNAALREHNSILETALAKREADLVQLNLQVLGPFAGGGGLAAGQVALGLAHFTSCSCPCHPQAETGNGEDLVTFGVSRGGAGLGAPDAPLNEVWRRWAPFVSFLAGGDLPVQADPTVYDGLFLCNSVLGYGTWGLSPDPVLTPQALWPL